MLCNYIAIANDCLCHYGLDNEDWPEEKCKACLITKIDWDIDDGISDINMEVDQKYMGD